MDVDPGERIHRDRRQEEPITLSSDRKTECELNIRHGEDVYEVSGWTQMGSMNEATGGQCPQELN